MSEGRVQQQAELAAQVLEYQGDCMCLLIKRRLQLHTSHCEKCLL